MIDSYTKVIYGWKLTGDNVGKIQEELENIDEDYINILDSFIIEDPMCGNYFYFGALLGSFDNDFGDDDAEIKVDEKLVEKYTSKYNKMLEDNPKIDKVFKKYQKEKPELYIMLNKW